MSWNIPLLTYKRRKAARECLELGPSGPFCTSLEPEEAREILRACGWSETRIYNLERGSRGVPTLRSKDL